MQDPISQKNDQLKKVLFRIKKKHVLSHLDILPL